MRPASKVLRCTLVGYSGLVVWRLSRGKCFILCDSCGQRALNGTMLAKVEAHSHLHSGRL